MFDRDNWGTLLIRWLMLAASVWVAAEIVSGIHLEGLVSTLVVAAILGILNLYLRPILVLLSLPFTILTLGFFIVVINAILPPFSLFFAVSICCLRFSLHLQHIAFSSLLFVPQFPFRQLS